MNFFKIAVLNNSGNVGKSTICDIFLKPRLKNAELISVETINSTANDDNKISSKDMISLMQRIDSTDVAIIDVGSSNIENFVRGIKDNIGAHEDIDLYLIPVTPETKQQKDTCNTVDELLDLGVEPDRIIIALNRIDDSQSLESQFKTLTSSNLFQTLYITELNDCIIIPESNVFTLIERLGSSYIEAINDSTNYREAIRNAESKDERSLLSLKKSCQRLVSSFNSKLDIEYTKLNKYF